MLKQLDHSKVYYAWLSTLSESLHNGEIFEHFLFQISITSKGIKFQSELYALRLLKCFTIVIHYHINMAVLNIKNPKLFNVFNILYKCNTTLNSFDIYNFMR